MESISKRELSADLEQFREQFSWIQRTGLLRAISISEIIAVFMDLKEVRRQMSSLDAMRGMGLTAAAGNTVTA